MNLKKMFKPIVVTTLLAVSHVSNAGLFTIEVNNLGGLTQSQSALFDNAVSTWESYLIGTQTDLNLNLVINAQGVDIDGSGGVLGQGGPDDGVVSGNFSYATTGIMRFDIADLASMESDGTLGAVILHEMAHVIGFGTIWNIGSYLNSMFAGTQNVYVNGTGRYTGAWALNEYRNEFDPNATYVPVELGGGSGTANAHWDEQWAGGKGELMTGTLDLPSTLSRTTIASFADIGYKTIVTHARQVSAPATLILFVTFLSLMLKRRR